MKQVLQNISNGETSLVDVPRPMIKENGLLISSNNSVISSGTEKMLIDFGKGNYLEKAKQQPEKVRSVLDKIIGLQFFSLGKYIFSFPEFLFLPLAIPIILTL